VVAQCEVGASSYDQLDALRAAVIAEAQPGDRIVVMSNGSFAGLPRLLLQDLEQELADV